MPNFLAEQNIRLLLFKSVLCSDFYHTTLTKHHRVSEILCLISFPVQVLWTMQWPGSKRSVCLSGFWSNIAIGLIMQYGNIIYTTYYTLCKKETGIIKFYQGVAFFLYALCAAETAFNITLTRRRNKGIYVINQKKML